MAKQGVNLIESITATDYEVVEAALQQHLTRISSLFCVLPGAVLRILASHSSDSSSLAEFQVSAPLVGTDGGCCFDMLRIKTATYIVGGIELFLAIIGLFLAVGNIAAYHKGADVMTKIIFAIQIVYFLLYIFLTILLFYGLRNDQASWVFWHLQATASIAVCILIYIILVIIAGFWLSLIYYLTVLGMLIFFVYVEYRCYQYMRGV